MSVRSTSDRSKVGILMSSSLITPMEWSTWLQPTMACDTYDVMFQGTAAMPLGFHLHKINSRSPCFAGVGNSVNMHNFASLGRPNPSKYPKRNHIILSNWFNLAGTHHKSSRPYWESQIRLYSQIYKFIEFLAILCSAEGFVPLSVVTQLPTEPPPEPSHVAPLTRVQAQLQDAKVVRYVVYL